MDLLCTYVFLFFIALIFFKYQHLITAVIDLSNYVCNYTVDPSLTPVSSSNLI